MSFIFKLLKFPFPFDCSLKLLHISLAWRADSRVHSIKQIFKPFCFWASSLRPKKNQQIVRVSQAKEIKKEHDKISSFVDQIKKKNIQDSIRPLKAETFLLFNLFYFLQASKTPLDCKQIGCLHQNVMLFSTTDIQDAEMAEPGIILMQNPSAKYSSAVSVLSKLLMDQR